MDKDVIQKLALRARVAQRVMLGFSSRKKRDILTAIADELERVREAILAANAQDLAEAARGLSTGAEVLDQCRALVRRAAPEILELAE